MAHDLRLQGPVLVAGPVQEPYPEHSLLKVSSPSPHSTEQPSLTQSPYSAAVKYIE